MLFFSWRRETNKEEKTWHKHNVKKHYPFLLNSNWYQCINIKDTVKNNCINNGQTQKQRNIHISYLMEQSWKQHVHSTVTNLQSTFYFLTFNKLYQYKLGKNNVIWKCKRKINTTHCLVAILDLLIPRELYFHYAWDIC